MDEHSFVKGPSEVKNGFLRYCGKVSVPLTPKRWVLGEFIFKCTRGMWVEGTFTDVLGESVSFELGDVEIEKYQLQEKTLNSHILFNIGERGIFKGNDKRETLKRIIASSITTQWMGGPGTFLTDLQSNLFYYEENGVQYVVRVFRTSTCPEWDVNMWKVDKKSSEQWEKGDVVFTPTP